jgi:hypothetical protein
VEHEIEIVEHRELLAQDEPDAGFDRRRHGQACRRSADATAFPAASSF